MSKNKENKPKELQLTFSDITHVQELSNKDLFLKTLKTRNGYRRYTKTPLRYGGGKTLAVGKIIEHIPQDISRLVSPFIGGGSVEIAVAKELNIEVVGYDTFELLVNYWNIQTERPKELYDKLKTLNNTKDEYEKVKKILKKIWNKYEGLVENNLTDLEMAAYYYFNHNLSYGPGFLGWMSSIYTQEKKYLSMIEKVKNFNVKNIKMFNEDFKMSIPKHSNDFLYLDPPYFLEGDSKMFKGIYPMRNFPIHHNGFDHYSLLHLLKKHKGGFVLSYNDCSWVREAYKDFQILNVSWQYTMGQGETRIGENRLQRSYDNGNTKKSHELIIKG